MWYSPKKSYTHHQDALALNDTNRNCSNFIVLCYLHNVLLIVQTPVMSTCLRALDHLIKAGHIKIKHFWKIGNQSYLVSRIWRGTHAFGVGLTHLAWDSRIWRGTHAFGVGLMHLAWDSRIWRGTHAFGVGLTHLAFISRSLPATWNSRAYWSSQ